MSGGRRAARGLCLFLSAGALAWAGASWAARPPGEDTARVGQRIARGEAFRPEILRQAADRVAASAELTCDARWLTAGLFVALQAADTARAEADLAMLDARLLLARRVARRTLACAPTSAFAWLALSWIETTREGFDERWVRYLARSYETGPKEIWVAVRRNPIAMNLLPQLPPALQEKAMQELVDLVQANQTDTALAVFTRLDAPLQAQIAERLGTLPYGARNGFARRLYRLGNETRIPGVSLPSDRPWAR